MENIGEYTYSDSQGEDFKEFAKLRAQYLAKTLQEIRPRKILELGCGEGSLGLVIKDLTHAEIFGVDWSESGVNLAKKKGIIAKRADLNKEIPFADESFDLVISDQLFEHIYNTDQLLKECKRVLKKGGYLITITPNLSFWLNRILFIFGIYPLFLEVSMKNKTFGLKSLKKLASGEEAMGHIRVFNLPALEDMIKSEGFKVEEEKGIPLTANLPFLVKVFFDLFDNFFAKKTSLARDMMIVARKNS